MTLYDADSTSFLGLLIQRASALALGFVACTPGSWLLSPTNTMSSEPWFTADTSHIQDEPAFATATSNETRAPSERSLVLIAQELEITKRLLSELQDNVAQHAVSYFARLEQIFNLAEQNQHVDVAGPIASLLSAARMQLLADVPTAREWGRLARAIAPEAQLRLPVRFVRASVRPVTSIDMDSLRTAARLRSLDV